MQNDPAPRKVKTFPLSVALTERQSVAIRHAALVSEETVSAFIREAALRRAVRILARGPRPARSTQAAAA
jgi:uncharacterized protein (DUF1778 family)